jgi:predicted dehydrogenase
VAAVKTGGILNLTSNKTISFGLVGLGGYAATTAELLCAMSADPRSGVRLTAACDPDLARNAAMVNRLREQGVVVMDRYTDLLQQPVEAVCLPVPIDLHRLFTEQALAAGKAVLCEKPAAGCIDDLDAMILARDRANLPAAIGFQDIYNPHLQHLKRRILEGDFGAVQSVALWAAWPRNSTYYARNDWAGRHQRKGVWVMDSPAANALAHQINIALFLMGPNMRQSATPTAVEAELYRAIPIENYDTCSIRATVGDTSTNATMLALFTHACRQKYGPFIELKCQRGTIRLDSMTRAEISINGKIEHLEMGPVSRTGMYGAFARHVAGDCEPILATFEVAKAHLLCVNGASEADVVHTLPAEWVEETTTPPQETQRSIRDIEKVFAACAERHQMLHESHLAPWSHSAGACDLTGYHHFAGPKQSM